MKPSLIMMQRYDENLVATIPKNECSSGHTYEVSTKTLLAKNRYSEQIVSPPENIRNDRVEYADMEQPLGA